ncbi:MAG: hypothetical protein QMD03_04775 [Syntrophales bacterium]|nr:hypothetical protein [Syntrophales bacterium]
MKRMVAVLFLFICSLLWLAGTAVAEDIANPLLKKLVEKGLLSREEAMSVEEDKESKDLAKIIKNLKGFKFGLLWYLSYQNGEDGQGSGDGFHQFVAKRGYLTVAKEFFPWFSSRMTLDITTVKDLEEPGDKPNNLDGSIAMRVKYLYGQFNLPNLGFFTQPFLEVGVVHMPWLDYEEHVNFYRCQDTMFLERNEIFNSADLGLTFVSLFGGKMDEDYQKRVSNYYPGRYGSMALGVYNGGGYHAAEKNDNKVIEGRLTLRPLPDIIPGLQFSYFGVYGKGNKEADPPDWRVNLGFVQFEHEYLVLTGQYYTGKGDQKGTDEKDKEGYSAFAELKPHKKFSIFGRYDRFDPDTDTGDDENTRYIAGVAYHLDKQHKNMIVLDYDHVNYEQSNKLNDKRVQLTLQVAL